MAPRVTALGTTHVTALHDPATHGVEARAVGAPVVPLHPRTPALALVAAPGTGAPVAALVRGTRAHLRVMR